MKRDKLFRLSLAILFLWTSFALAAPAAMALTAHASAIDSASEQLTPKRTSFVCGTAS